MYVIVIIFTSTASSSVAEQGVLFLFSAHYKAFPHSLTITAIRFDLPTGVSKDAIVIRVSVTVNHYNHSKRYLVKIEKK